MNTHKQNLLALSDDPKENLYRDEYFRGVVNHTQQCCNSNCAVIADMQMLLDRGLIGDYYISRMNDTYMYTCVQDVSVLYRNAENYSK